LESNHDRTTCKGSPPWRRAPCLGMGRPPPPWAEKPCDDFVEREGRTQSGRDCRPNLGNGHRAVRQGRHHARAASLKSEVRLGKKDPPSFRAAKSPLGSQPRI